MKKLSGFKGALFFLVLMVSAYTFAQKDISGTVTDSNGAPLPGVTVVEKATSNGVSTDFDGNYSISNVANNAILLFSYLGFKSQEIQVGNQSTINVSLQEDVTQLDDVVVVGYGTKKKAEVIGSVVQVSGELTEQNPQVNFATSLAGRLPGLVVNQTTAEPGREDIDILIRGRGTFDSNAADGINPNAVLVVIDGVIGADGLSGLNPQDIESVSVLKDASAAIYGSRAANGVILVTTKRGKTGKPVFDYTINTGFTAPTRFAERASALELALQSRAIIERDPSASIQTFTDEEIAAFRDPNFKNTDWFKEVYDRTSYQTRHNLSLRGGTETTNYFLSFGTSQREGIVTNDNVTDVRQYNFRSNIDIAATNNLSVSLDLAGRFDKNQYFASNSFDVLVNAANGLPFETPSVDGKPLRISGGEGLNPLTHANSTGGYRRQRNTLFNGKLALVYKIPRLKGLSVGGWAAVRLRQDFAKRFDRPLTQYILEDDGTLVEDVFEREVKVTENYERDLEVTSHINLTYQGTFEKHSINAFLAYEQSQSRFNSTEASRRGFLSSDVDQLSSGSIDTQENDAFASEGGRQNYIGRLGYDFDKKYFAQFHFRYDGSFNFPRDNRFGFFPGVSLGWVLSKENFLKESKTISNLKLRGSWGRLGNDLIPQFQFLNRFGIDGSFPFGTGTLADASVVSQIGVLANPNVTWETSETYNLGLDAGFFDNRLTLELDLFKEERNDILAPRSVTIPLFTGVTQEARPFENIGIAENKGFELSLGYRTNFGAVGFNINGNIAYTKNKLVFQDAVEPVEDYQNLEGRPIGSRLLYNAIGIYRNQADLDNFPGLANAGIGDLIYADTNGDGELTPADRIVFDKTSTPETQFGLNLGLNYKGIELSALFQGQTNANAELNAIYGQGDLSYVLRNAYTVDTPNSILPRIGATESSRNGYDGNENASNFWQRDVSFVRLKTVQLAYTLPKDALAKVGISNARIFLSGSNLLTFDGLKKDGLADPEQNIGLSWSIPLQQVYNLGANITF